MTETLAPMTSDERNDVDPAVYDAAGRRCNRIHGVRYSPCDDCLRLEGTYAAIDADPVYDVADLIAEWLEQHPDATVTASSAAKAVSTAAAPVSTPQAAHALALLVRMGTLTDQAGRGGAWTRWALARR